MPGLILDFPRRTLSRSTPKVRTMGAAKQYAKKESGSKRAKSRGGEAASAKRR